MVLDPAYVRDVRDVKNNIELWHGPKNELLLPALLTGGSPMGRRARGSSGGRGGGQTPEAEAQRLSQIEGSALPGDLDSFDGSGPEQYEDPDLAELNDPEVDQLVEPPLLGRQTQASDLYGDMAGGVGAPSSPPLFAQAAQFPNCIQLRVWRWENGVPNALGAIAATAGEDEFVRLFFAAMPKAGERQAMYKFRPVDINGRQLGKEFTSVISEHHVMLQRIREEKAMADHGNGHGQWGRDVVVQGNDGGGAVYAEEMGRMFEHSVEMAEKQTDLYQRQLEEERRTLREMEQKRTEERVNTAERASNVVEKMTEKLMATDRVRSEEVQKAQERQHSVVLSTITTTFQQQQEAARLGAEQQRAADLRRAEQDREFYDRQRKESEDRRRLEREESEAKRKAEKDEVEDRRRTEREEWDRKWTASQAEADRKAATEKVEADRRRDIEKADADRRRDLERQELDLRREQIKSENDRYLKEVEERRRMDREETERREKREQERRDSEKVEGATRLELQLKQLEVAATRDREHAERMMESARQEREVAREIGLQREKMEREARDTREKGEREAREAADKERHRQHEIAMKEMEIARERDREHGERMIQLTRMQNSGGLGGLSAITDVLGMDTPELLGRIFGGGGGDGESGKWVDAIPKALTALADIGKVITQQPQPKLTENPPKKEKPKPQPQITAQEQKYYVRMPDGSTRLVSSAELQKLQINPNNLQPGDELPNMPYQPTPEVTPVSEPKNGVTPAEPKVPEEADKYRAGLAVNALRRANAASLSLAQQRAGRKGVKDLVKQLSKAEESEWPGLVVAAMAKTPDIFHYLRVVSLYVALAEARAGAELSVKIANAIRGSGKVPDGAFPYDEADFERMLLEEAAKAAKELASGIKEDEISERTDEKADEKGATA